MIEQLEMDNPTVVSTSSINAENMSIGGNINQYIHSRQKRLVRVNFGTSDEEYLPPNFTDALFRQTVEKGIVFISGEQSYGKEDLSRHIARKLVERDEFDGLEVVELLQENDNQDNRRTSIFDILSQEETEEKIVLLYNLHPEKIDYDFSKLLNYAHEKKCVFIISVSYSLEIWRKSGLVDDYWFQIPNTRHYSEAQIHGFFLHKLSQLRPAFLEDDVEINDTTLLSNSVPVQDAVVRFNSIDQVNLFLNYYAGFLEFPSDRKLNELIETLCLGYDQLVKAWFYQLSHRNKILALSAAMFDGLLIDQYFEVLHSITEDSFWQTSDVSLKAVDYFDLTFLDVFFQVQCKGDSLYLNSRSSTTKQALLELGKTEYRRHFKVALQSFRQFTEISYSKQRINWEMYGTVPKRVLIRKIFTQAIRDIGTLEFGIVENHLIELAASSNGYLQSIGAKSMAQWRLSGHEEQFFSTLKNWQKDENIAARIKELFERNTANSETDHVNAIDLIKVTAVLALGHASYYDQPNNLHEDIVKMMVHFAKEPSKRVSESICKALPKFIHHHSLQLQHILFDELMPIYGLREPIIEGLMLAMNDYPREVSAALERWFSNCKEDHSLSNRRQKPTQRDNALIIIIDILTRMDLQDHPDFPIEKLYQEILIPLLKNEKRSEVVDAVISLLAKVQTINFRMAVRFSDATIGLLDKRRRLDLVAAWGKIYKKQRLETREFYYKDELKYPVWTGDQNRPLTPVEEVLFQWMEGSTTLRRFATLAFLEIEFSYDQFERQELARLAWEKEQFLQAQRQAAQSQSTMVMVPQMPAEIGLNFLFRIKIFLYFLFSSNQNKYLFKDTVLLFLNVHRYSTEDLASVIRKWKTYAGGSITSKLGRWLMRFM